MICHFEFYRLWIFLSFICHLYFLILIKGSHWVPSNAYSGVPVGAVVAGHDVDGATIYVGRAFHGGDSIPAKVIPSKKVAYIPHGGQEIAKYEYQVRMS